MAAEAEGLLIRPLDGKYKTCLTRIGLLMEGLGPNIVDLHLRANPQNSLSSIDSLGLGCLYFSGRE
jgi:hypothetical protein